MAVDSGPTIRELADSLSTFRRSRLKLDVGATIPRCGARFIVPSNRRRKCLRRYP
jgi:hypothetical protein